MTEKESPHARFYDQGNTAGLAGVSIEECPYRPTAQQTREQRLEQLARRAAWLEGHADGISIRRQQLRTRAIAQRRYQRKVLRRNGQPERYVDRRLRQIAAEQKGA